MSTKPASHVWKDYTFYEYEGEPIDRLRKANRPYGVPEIGQQFILDEKYQGPGVPFGTKCLIPFRVIKGLIVFHAMETAPHVIANSRPWAELDELNDRGYKIIPTPVAWRMKFVMPEFAVHASVRGTPDAFKKALLRVSQHTDIKIWVNPHPGTLLTVEQDYFPSIKKV